MIIDQYQPDMLWFDGLAAPPPPKMRLRWPRGYYISAAEWKKQVPSAPKAADYPAAAVLDYERQGRIRPRGLKDFAWQGRPHGQQVRLRDRNPIQARRPPHPPGSSIARA